MSEIDVSKTSFTHLATEMTFVVNEFPRIQVPSKQKKDPEQFNEMSTAKRQKLMERLIDRVKEI